MIELPEAFTFTAEDQGVHRFENIVLGTPGVHTVSITDGDLTATTVSAAGDIDSIEVAAGGTASGNVTSAISTSKNAGIFFVTELFLSAFQAQRQILTFRGATST